MSQYKDLDYVQEGAFGKIKCGSNIEIIFGSKENNEGRGHVGIDEEKEQIRYVRSSNEITISGLWVSGQSIDLKRLNPIVSGNMLILY